MIDNVPLVAASMGMFDLAMDDTVWHFIAYWQVLEEVCLLLDLQRVVAMGMEKYPFFGI